MHSELTGLVREFLAGHDPASMDRLEFLRARFDAGLAWVTVIVHLRWESRPLRDLALRARGRTSRIARA